MGLDFNEPKPEKARKQATGTFNGSCNLCFVLMYIGDYNSVLCSKEQEEMRLKKKKQK